MSEPILSILRKLGPKQEPVVNPRKDRSLSGKARVKARKAANRAGRE